MVEPLIDTHCHLADPRLYQSIDEVLERARHAGLSQIISVGAIGSLDADRLTVEIAQRNPDVFAAIGIHPHHASECNRARLDGLKQLARSTRVVAIGETGLDFHYMHSSAAAQEDSLRCHLELAAELALPVVIHCRDAERRLLEIFHKVGLPPAGGVIHCFTGDADSARDFLALGFHISFSGILTFKNAGPLRAAASAVPDDRLMVETDAPYLAPEPHRGARNEPAYVRLTIETLARLRDADCGQLCRQVIANARRLFRLPAG